MTKEGDDKLGKVYFPNLNGLRFIAAFLVLWVHLDAFMPDFGLEALGILKNIRLGFLSVILFFVLSGFLITYLLFAEERVTGTIHILSFYKRRILRIWPLYFVLFIFAFFIVPRFPFFETAQFNSEAYNLKNFLLYLFILPNLAMPVQYISQSWSIGVEEQFYIMWPILMKYVKNKLLLLISIIVIYLLVYFVFVVISESSLAHRMPSIYNIRYRWELFSIDCMAIGGLFAYIYLYKKTWLDILYNKYLNIALLLFLLITPFVNINIPYLNKEVFAVLFGLLILNLATNPKSLVNLEYKIFSYLGKISYGIYMYHILGCILSLKLAVYLNLTNPILILLIATAITIAISSASYHLLEEYFIKRKIKFSKIISGENVKK